MVAKEETKRLTVTPPNTAPDSQPNTINPADYKTAEDYIHAVAQSQGKSQLRDRQIKALRNEYNRVKGAADAAQAAKDAAFKAAQDKVAAQIEAEKNPKSAPASSASENKGPGLGNVNPNAGTLTPNTQGASGTTGATLGTGQTRWIQQRPDGQYTIMDSQGQTTVVNKQQAAAAAKAANIQILKSTDTPPSDATGFNNPAGANFPGSTNLYVMLPDTTGKKLVQTSIADAYNFAYSNLGSIRKTLLQANQLTKSEASDPTRLLSKWQEILLGASMNPDHKNPFDYANYLKSQGFGSTGTTGQGAYTTVSSKDEALNAINAAFDKAYHRLPTPAEVTTWTKKLNNAQIANPSKPNVVGGVTRYEGGIGSPDLWVQNQLTNTKEYKDVQGRLQSNAAQALASAAADNGITLTPAQTLDWTNRLTKGESIDNIKASIRDLAALGQPDSVKNLLKQGVDLSTIYSPYKQAMAQILEVNPATITLNDPTLRSAITPQGEMSLYDYQNALRKDPRWQYTNNAKTAVADSVSQVLKDFGFMG